MKYYKILYCVRIHHTNGREKKNNRMIFKTCKLQYVLFDLSYSFRHFSSKHFYQYPFPNANEWLLNIGKNQTKCQIGFLFSVISNVSDRCFDCSNLLFFSFNFCMCVVDLRMKWRLYACLFRKTAQLTERQRKREKKTTHLHTHTHTYKLNHAELFTNTLFCILMTI